jgi:hypothetical protein
VHPQATIIFTPHDLSTSDIVGQIARDCLEHIGGRHNAQCRTIANQEAAETRIGDFDSHFLGGIEYVEPHDFAFASGHSIMLR